MNDRWLFVYYYRAGSGAVSNWILEAGLWDDSATWIDTSFWID